MNLTLIRSAAVAAIQTQALGLIAGAKNVDSKPMEPATVNNSAASSNRSLPPLSPAFQAACMTAAASAAATASQGIDVIRTRLMAQL